MYHPCEKKIVHRLITLEMGIIVLLIKKGTDHSHFIVLHVQSAFFPLYPDLVKFHNIRENKEVKKQQYRFCTYQEKLSHISYSVCVCNNRKCSLKFITTVISYLGNLCSLANLILTRHNPLEILFPVNEILFNHTEIMLCFIKLMTFLIAAVTPQYLRLAGARLILQCGTIRVSSDRSLSDLSLFLLASQTFHDGSSSQGSLPPFPPRTNRATRLTC